MITEDQRTRGFRRPVAAEDQRSNGYRGPEEQCAQRTSGTVHRVKYGLGHWKNDKNFHFPHVL